MGQNLPLQISPVVFDPPLVFLVELCLYRRALLVVEVESHAVEVQSFPRSQIDVVSLLGKGFFDGLFPLEFFIAYFDKQANHFPNLMIDEALPHQSESEEGHAMFFPLFFRVVLLEAIFNSFGLDELNLHSHDISVISFVVLFISFGKVMVTMGSQVEGSQTIQLGDQLLSLELV